VIPAPESNPDALFRLFERDRAVHPYGLADLEEPFWSASRWFRHREAAVGVIELPASPVAIVYAVSATAPAATSALLGELAHATELPRHCFVTGPVGMAEHLDPTHRALWCAPHTRMRLAGSPQRGRLGSPAGERLLGLDDLTAVEVLFAAAPDAGRFFTPTMLATGAYLGRFDGDLLIAMAGVHVVSERHKVAALGNVLTHPAHRRQAHAAELVRALCALLHDRGIDVIGLNVSDDNHGARRLYDSVGFVPVIPFDEGEFIAR